MDGSTRIKRKRNVTNGRMNWTNDGKIVFAEFCLAEYQLGKFERPSQKAFVRRFKQYHLPNESIEVGLLRNSHENKLVCLLNAMKKRYKETKDWTEIDGVSLLASDPLGFQASVKKRCPHFYQFEGMFGGSRNINFTHFSQINNCTTTTTAVGEFEVDEFCSELDESHESNDGGEETEESQEDASKNEPIPTPAMERIPVCADQTQAKKVRAAATIELANAIARRESQRDAINTARISWEREKWDKEREERERRFMLEEKIAMGNLEFQREKMKFDAEERQKEREHELKLKELELECLKLKYSMLEYK